MTNIGTTYRIPEWPRMSEFILMTWWLSEPDLAMEVLQKRCRLWAECQYVDAAIGHRQVSEVYLYDYPLRNGC